jgi:hypothetical protein
MEPVSVKPVMRKKEIIAAILKTQCDILPLDKNEKNEYKDYFYASIDQYYLLVATKARENGLTWVMSETEAIVGHEYTKHVYAVELQYKDGTTYPNYAQISVLHPLMGAQGAGSAMSYAEKIFMRMVFKVPTGEGDADATNPRPRPATKRFLQAFKDNKDQQAKGPVRYAPDAPPQSAPQQGDGSPEPPAYLSEPDGLEGSYEGNYQPPAPPIDIDKMDKIERDMIGFARTAHDIAALNHYWKSQSRVLTEMQQTDPERYNRIGRAFGDRKKLVRQPPPPKPEPIRQRYIPQERTSRPPPGEPSRTLAPPKRV